MSKVYLTDELDLIINKLQAMFPIFTKNIDVVKAGLLQLESTADKGGELVFKAKQTKTPQELNSERLLLLRELKKKHNVTKSKPMTREEFNELKYV